MTCLLMPAKRRKRCLERGGDINDQDNEVFSKIEKKKREKVNSLENVVMLLQSDKKEIQEVENGVQSKNMTINKEYVSA